MRSSGILDITCTTATVFVRTQGYLPSENDCYVRPFAWSRRNGLRKGDLVVAQTTRPSDRTRSIAPSHKITYRQRQAPVEELGRRVRFADLTPVYPARAA